VPAGKTVAIVDPPVRQIDDLGLLFRLYESPVANLIDGRNPERSRRLRCVPRSAWCRRIPAVQRHHPYNIRYGPGRGDAEVEEAAQLAQIDILSGCPKAITSRRAGLEIVGARTAVAIARPSEGAARSWCG